MKSLKISTSNFNLKHIRKQKKKHELNAKYKKNILTINNHNFFEKWNSKVFIKLF